MKSKNLFFGYLIFVASLFSVEVQASSSEAEALQLCRESLGGSAVSFDRVVGVSAYRLFNKFPPVGLGEVGIDTVYRSLGSKISPVKISVECFREELLKSASWYPAGKEVKVSNEDVVPIQVIRKEGVYLLVFVYPGYIDSEGTADEVAVGMAVYEVSGKLVKVLERIASWANNEGTLVLLDSCLHDETISYSERRVDPDEVTERGKVITYDSVFDVSKSMEYLFAEISGSSGGYECPASSYIRVKK